MNFSTSERLVAGATEQSPEIDLLVVRLSAEMGERWRQGERPIAEEYFDLHPQLRDNPESAIDLIYEEVCLRQKYEPDKSPSEVLQRFPKWRAQLEILLECHRALEQGPAPAHFPRAGMSLGEFHLLAELGRGAQGRVFAAKQSSLADRLVVLKITPATGGEHLSLARLQHTHIVPLYGVEYEPARNWRILCMPYFGGATLAQLLKAQHKPLADRSGQDLLRALDEVQTALTAPPKSSVRQSLARSSYVQAVCWIGACLADALQYAHEHELVHLDLKPSNVLIAADGQPMLLDFHLAHAPLRAGDPPPDWLGGTPHYMSPEQQRALAAVRHGQALAEDVDGRSDIYSLGLVLYEALGGTLPVPETGPAPSLQRINPQVSRGLADVVAKCLARAPRSRYTAAADLAADLRRHLADKPLRGVPNRSWHERWCKWRRRQPFVLPVVVLTLALLCTAGTLFFMFQSQREKQYEEIRRELADGQFEFHQGRYEHALRHLKGGLSLAENLPEDLELKKQLRAHLDRTQKKQLAEELHALVDRLRNLYGLELSGSAELEGLAAGCQAFWVKRRQIMERLGPDQDTDTRQRLEGDLLDLALLWTDLRIRLARPGALVAAHRDALAILDEAEAQFGPSPVLACERRLHVEALGLTDEARPPSKLAPRTAWEYYAVGRSLLRAEHLTRAAEALEQAVRLEPEGLWPNFYLGLCCYRRGQYDDAVIAFTTVCAQKEPKIASCYYNRALALSALGRPERALADYDRALEIEPDLAAALLNRGILHYQAKRLDRAGADLQSALKHGASSAVVHYNLALVSHARGDQNAAREHLRQALGHDPQHAEARELQQRLTRKP